MTGEFITPGGSIKTYPGVHKYAIAARNNAHERSQMNDFIDELTLYGGRILSEKRQILKQGTLYIVITYEI